MTKKNVLLFELIDDRKKNIGTFEKQIIVYGNYIIYKI